MHTRTLLLLFGLLLAPTADGRPGSEPFPIPLPSAFAHGTGWSDVGGGINQTVEAVVVDEATGAVYAAGTFTQAGSASESGFMVAKWDGATWTSLGAANDWIFSLAIGTNGVLYAGGRFTEIDGVAATRIAVWNPATETWSAIGVGFNNPVQAILEGPDGCIYAAGGFRIIGDTSGGNVAVTCTEEVWEYVGGGTSDVVYDMAFDAAGRLYVVGAFGQAGGVAASRVARWDPAASAWGALGTGITQVGGGPAVYTLTFDADGALYIGGNFSEAGGVSVNSIARWDGAAWSGVGNGVTGTTGGSTAVRSLVFDEGGVLYAGGSFAEAGGVTVNSAARWDGATWASLDGGVGNGTILDMAIGGDYLYAGGGFSDIGGTVGLNFFAKWEGILTTPTEETAAPAASAVLRPAFPNPFASETTLRFELPRAQAVRLDLFDVLGRPVAVLFDGEAPAGRDVEVRLDGRSLPAGLYVARLWGDGVQTVQRLTLIR